MQLIIGKYENPPGPGWGGYEWREVTRLEQDGRSFISGTHVKALEEMNEETLSRAAELVLQAGQALGAAVAEQARLKYAEREDIREKIKPLIARLRSTDEAAMHVADDLEDLIRG